MVRIIQGKKRKLENDAKKKEEDNVDGAENFKEKAVELKVGSFCF
jgi:hypothetical protein